MAKFFINRPIFASVISIIIVIAGLMAARSLPIAQYPEIAAPSVTITANYPGASAKTVEDTVTQVIEQRMKGIDTIGMGREMARRRVMAQDEVRALA